MVHQIKEVDLEIIRQIYNLQRSEEITTYTLAKRIFSAEGISKKYKFYTDKTNYLDYRMEVLQKAGLIDVAKNNGRKVYTLILNNVYFARIRKKRLNIDKVAVFLRISNKWEIFLG